MRQLMTRSISNCKECNGTGEMEYEVTVPMSNSVSSGYVDSVWGHCEYCNGTGEEVEEED